MLKRIVSGGQTGADRGGLLAAEDLRIPTGGFMPHGFLDEWGPNPELAKRFNLVEHSSTSYLKRTRANIMSADGTVLFGDLNSPGSAVTARFVRQYNLPLYTFPWRGNKGNFDKIDPIFLLWLQENNIRTLNVAGNRESVTPGICAAVRNYLFINLDQI